MLNPSVCKLVMYSYKGIYVALHGTPDALGVLLPWCSCLSMAILGNSGVGALWAWCIRSASSYLPILCKRCCDVICDVTVLHMTFYYKRSTGTSVGGSRLLFIHSSGSTLSPETCVWLVPNACRS